MLLLSAKKAMTSLKPKKHEQLGRIVVISCQQDHRMIRESCGLSQGLPLFIRPYTNQTPWIYEVRWERIGTNPPHRIRILTKMDGNKWTICTICIYVLHGTGIYTYIVLSQMQVNTSNPMEHLGILGMGIEFPLTIWSLSSNFRGKKRKTCHQWAREEIICHTGV